MPARLSRKRYTEITRYLKTVISDEIRSDRLRMTAVESLLEVYARHDRTEAQKEARKWGAEAVQGSEQPTAPPEAPESAEERAERFLERIRAQRESKTNG
jgi:hypothetical protein